MGNPTVTPDISYDAVILLPGIMGSALADRTTKTELWGFSKLAQYSKLWASDAAFRDLALTEQELAGDFSRVCPTGILKDPAFAPVLRGFNPYGELAKGIRKVLAHHDALLEFAYDWRLPVEHNARELAKAARQHLDAWGEHAVYRARRIEHPPKLVIVAHSMGGLVVRALPLVERKDGDPLTPEIRATVTLGTPFFGAAKSVMTLARGDGSSRLIHKERLRKLAVGLPGIYDLLPMRACVEDGETVRRLEGGDVTAIGGDAEETKRAIEFHDRLAGVLMPTHRPLIGTDQPTITGLAFDSGVVKPCNLEFQWDSDKPVLDDNRRPMRQPRGGDGTVARDAASIAGSKASYLAQQHGALASSPEALTHVNAIITERALREQLGDGKIGIDVPDVVVSGETRYVTVTGIDKGGEATCAIYPLDRKSTVEYPAIELQDGELRAQVVASSPGIYRVEVSGGATSPVTQLVLVV
jgi:hypothetical protein